jgi:hypothetical protein
MLLEFFGNFWLLSQSIAVYIVAGIFIAALLKRYVSDSFIQKQLGVRSKKTVFKAALIGIPLPLCSCSVIPFALSLKKSGANKASLSSFLISTPVIGIDSFLASYGAFGWVFAIYRVFTSFIAASVAGLVSLFFDTQNDNIKDKEAACSSCCANASSKQIGIFDYAYNRLFKDIAKPMLYGLVLASVLVTLLPKDMDIFLTNNLLLSYLFILAVSVPLYICATSSIPLGIALLVAGFSPGTAFLLLSAGPATSFISIAVVKKILGMRGVILYVGSIVGTSLIFALVLDMFFAPYVNVVSVQTVGESGGIVTGLFAVLFLGMIFYETIKGVIDGKNNTL